MSRRDPRQRDMTPRLSRQWAEFQGKRSPFGVEPAGFSAAKIYEEQQSRKTPGTIHRPLKRRVVTLLEEI